MILNPDVQTFSSLLYFILCVRKLMYYGYENLYIELTSILLGK